MICRECFYSTGIQCWKTIPTRFQKGGKSKSESKNLKFKSENPEVSSLNGIPTALKPGLAEICYPSLFQELLGWRILGFVLPDLGGGLDDGSFQKIPDIPDQFCFLKKNRENSVDPEQETQS